MIYDLLFPYQKEITDKAKLNDSSGLFMDTGTGKSITSLALFEQKVLQGKCTKLIIICLKSKLFEWEIDCNKFFPFSKILVMDGTKTANKDKQLENLDFDILIINFEKVWRRSYLLHITSKYFILVDESHCIKDSKSKIGKFMQLLGMQTPYKLILTATPMGNGYIDLYNQYYFLGYLNSKLSKFKQDYCIEKKQFNGSYSYPKIVGYKNTDKLDYITQEYCYFYERTLDNDMIPEEIVVPFKLDPIYLKVVKERVYKDISLDNTASKRIGLKTLCSGTIIGKTLFDAKGELNRTYQLNNDKIEWIKDFLEGFKERVVIYYEFNHQRDQLYEAITKSGRTCARYCGGYKEKEIYLNNSDAVILIQYKSGSTGIDWLKSSYICIFYCLPDGYLTYYQAKGRLNRVGQTKKVLYYLLLAKGKLSADELNYNALMNQVDFNDDYFERNFGK